MSTFSLQMLRALFLATILAGALAGSAMAQAPDASCALPSEPEGIPAALDAAITGPADKDRACMKALLIPEAWTRSHGIYRSRCEFGTQTRCAKNIYGATIATATATRIDARSRATWDDAFAFAPAAGCKAAALTGRALRIFRTTHDFVGASDIRAASRCRLRVGVAARHNDA
jgi:hypothetical protein